MLKLYFKEFIFSKEYFDYFDKSFLDFVLIFKSDFFINYFFKYRRGILNHFKEKIFQLILIITSLTLISFYN